MLYLDFLTAEAVLIKIFLLIISCGFTLNTISAASCKSTVQFAVITIALVLIVSVKLLFVCVTLLENSFGKLNIDSTTLLLMKYDTMSGFLGSSSVSTSRLPVTLVSFCSVWVCPAPHSVYISPKFFQCW